MQCLRNDYGSAKTKQKSHIIKKNLTLKVRSIVKNLKPRPSRIDRVIARSLQGLGLRFLRKARSRLLRG